MAAKRSPILGYNHNVRFRGVVFHVQTEDSGISNPHVFTHLFHGGVIVNTRKLVYDAEAAEETVKALMQSQHKAVLRELKSGSFDDKIDAYLFGTPGLLPRGTDDGGAPAEQTKPVPLVEEPTPPATDLATLSRAPTESPSAAMIESLPVPPAQPRTPTPAELSVPMPVIPARTTAPRMAAVSAIPSVPSAPATTTGLPPTTAAVPPTPRITQTRAAMPAPGVRPKGDTTPPPVAPASFESLFPPAEPGEERREVSQAFKAMQVEENDVAEIHSPAQPSVALPPGAAPERPGEYAQHRKRESGPMAPILTPRPAGSVRPQTVPPPSAPPAASPAPAPRTSPPPLPPRPTDAARVPPPLAPAQPRPAPPIAPATPARGMVPPVARPAVPPVAPPRAVTPAPTVPRVVTPSRASPALPRSRPPSGGGVVMSKPAVIVGAPSKVVGGPAPTGPRPPSGRIRKARDDSESGMFGQDLISEKSLDEVILAYLSEDSTDDG